MATNKNWLILLVVLCSWGNCFGQPLLRDKLVKTAESYLYVREKTGHNDGPEVEKFLKNVGLRKGNAWCAAYVATCHIENNIENPRSAYCPDWFRTHVVYSKYGLNNKNFVYKPGQVFGLYFENKKRIAHVGIITGETKFSYTTIEGNTDGSGSREGDGVYRMLRNKRSIYMISDYCK